MQFKAVTREQCIETSVATGDAEGAASYTWAFIDSISKGDFEEHSEDLKKILGREPENLRDTIPKVFNLSCTLARY